MESNEPTRPTIDRDLIARDLDRLATILAPLVEARLPAGAGMLLAMNGSPRVSEMVAASLRRALDLSDDELAALIDVGGVELGAWRGVRQAVGPDYVDAHPELAGAARHIVEVLA